MMLPEGFQPTKAPTSAELDAMSDDVLRAARDWCTTENDTTVWYDFWNDEVNRRTGERLTRELVDATEALRAQTAAAGRTNTLVMW
jgi:hypothetical protein